MLYGGVLLFEGKSRYTQYSTGLTELFKQLDKHSTRLCFEVGDIGYPSCRKGVATMVDAVFTFNPPIVALCIQAG